MILLNTLKKRGPPVVHLGNKVLSLLLFDDDIALVARSRSELQTLLDLTAEYLEEKKPEINTKILKESLRSWMQVRVNCLPLNGSGYRYFDSKGNFTPVPGYNY